MKKQLLLFVLLLLPIIASADVVEIDGINYDLDLSSQTAQVTSGGSYSGDVVIPSSVSYFDNEYNITAISSNAFYGCSDLTSVTIPNSVTIIGSYAFRMCYGLTSVTIPNSVTIIGSYAFGDCSGLTSVHISDLDAWCKISFGDGSNPLSYAHHLYMNGEEIKDLVIPNSVTSIRDNAFYGCSGLTSITIPNSVTSIGYTAFCKCSGLTSITIPNSVTSIGGWAFAGCSDLTSITVEEENTVYDSRENCNAIIETASNTLLWGCTNTIIPNSVTSIGISAFYGCSGLTSITIPNSVTSIWEYVFSGCSGLTSITIPNSVTSIGNAAFAGCSGLTSITIPNSVTSIGDFAFSGCTNLTKVELDCNEIISNTSSSNILGNIFGNQVEEYVIGNAVTSIGNHAFFGCKGLTSITIPNSVTSIGAYAFYNCSGLTSVYISDIESWYKVQCNSNPLDYAHHLYLNDEEIADLVIPNSIEMIREGAFKNCTGLSSVTIPNSVTSIGSSAFSGCSNLTKVELDNNEIVSKDYGNNDNIGNIFGKQVKEYVLGNSVTSIGDRAFYSCSGLTSITIPNSVTSIGYTAFADCSGLTSITIPNSVTSIGGWAFYGCSGLTSITIPNSVTSIGQYTFSGCSGLTSITIPNGVTSIGQYAFSGCSDLTSITVEEENTVYDSRENCNAIIETASNTLLWGCTNTIIPNSVTSIGYNAFSGCTGLTSITIPNGVTSIGSETFKDCSDLTSITIPNSVTSIGQSAFSGTAWYNNQPDGLVYAGKNVYKYKGTMPNNTSIVIDEGTYSISPYAFTDCSRLTSITIPNSVTSIGSSAFRNCSRLTSITIPNSVTSIGSETFKDCSGLTSVHISDLDAWCKISFCDGSSNPLSYAHHLYMNGEEIKDLVIPNSVTSIGQYTFSGCSGLTSITIPNSVTSIGSETFKDCSGLTSITIPNSVTSIGYTAFADCSGLTSITIPNSVTSIGGWAFYGCSGLTSITIPNSVTSIGYNAFYGCSSLRYIFSLIENPFSLIEHPYSLNESTFSSNIYNDAILYVPEGAKEKYATTEGWERFKITKEMMETNNINYILNTYSNTAEVTVGLYSGDIIIPSTVTYEGIDYSVTSIGYSAFSNCPDLTSIIIPNSVKSIGIYAFSSCSGLTSITIPQSVTSIGENAFLNCTNLTKVELDCNGIVSKKYASNNSIGNIFGKQVEEYVLGNGVTSIGQYAFYGCSGLTSVTIPNSITSIGQYAFYGCSGLTSVYISDIESWCKVLCNSNPLDYAHHLYLNDEEIADLVIPNSIEMIREGAFKNCTGLSSVTIPNSVTSIGQYAFYGCSGLTSVTIPNSITSIGSSAFRSCSGLTSITIPNSVTSIGSSAFRNCSGLTLITIPNSVTSIGEYAFSECTNLTKVELDCDGIVSKKYASNNSIGNIFGKQVEEYVLGNGVTSIGQYAFYGCSGLTSVTIPNSITSIGQYAFYGCSGLTSVYISDIESWCKVLCNSNPLDYAYHLYLNDEEIADLVIPNSIEMIREGAFKNCTGLSSVTIPNSVTSIGSSAFSGCSNLTKVELDNNEIVSKEYGNNDNIGNIFGKQVKEYVLGNSVTSIGDRAFYSCSGLTSITIPNSVTSIGSSAFRDCSGLISITIPNSVTTIGAYAFYGCSGLTSVHISDVAAWCNIQCSGNPFNYTHDLYLNDEKINDLVIPNSVTSIGDYAFIGCTGLTSVTIPNSVTRIGGYAFSYCFSLTSVTIPNSVTSIGSSAFRNCSGLTLITIPNSVTSIGEYAFSECTNLTKVELNCNEIVSKEYSTSSSLISKLFGSQVEELILGEGITSVGDYAFYGCAKMKTIDIASTMTSIGTRAFSGSDKLADVTCRALTVPETKTAFENSYPDFATLHVPAASLSAYQTTAPWSYFKNITALAMPTYTLTYMVDEEKYKTYQIEEGAVITPEAEPEKEGYTFSGWSEIPATMPAHDVTVTGTFSINKYKLTYLIDGEEYKTYDVEYGATITPEAAPADKEGYTFSGWSEIPEKMPAHDVTITATFSVNKYKLAYMVDGAEYKTSEVEYGATITPEAEPEKDGYTFSGWSEIPETMPAHDVTVTGTFTLDTGINQIMSDENGNAMIFTIDGRRVNKLQKNLNIIRMKDGITRKVMMK